MWAQNTLCSNYGHVLYFVTPVQFVLYLDSAVAGLSSQRIRFDPRLDHVGFWVDKVTCRQDLLCVHQFPPVRIIPPILHTHIASIYLWLYIILTRQTMYVWCNVGSRSCNHCWSGNTMSITHSECVCSLGNRACKTHAAYCHLWPVWFYSILTHYLINGTIFGEERVTQHDLCVLIVCTNAVWNVSHSKKDWMRYGQKWNVKYPLFLSDFN